MVIIPRCVDCKHLNQDRSLPAMSCAAYPDGIPQEIVNNSLFHDRPYPGDHEIRFELFEEKPVQEGVIQS